MEENQTSRPPKVGTAIKLLYITLGLGILRSALEASTLLQAPSPALVIFKKALVFGVIWFFIFMIARGRNWARITFLVLFVGGLPIAVLQLWQSLTAYPIFGLLDFSQTVIQIVALVLLFQKASSAWFKARN